MTAEQAAVFAMARTSEITDQYPSTRSLMYRRLGLRQRQLMGMAARVNPDYYGVCAISPLDADTATDLNDIIEPVPTPEALQAVTVSDPGTSALAAGQSIAIVPWDQRDAELPPRATLRDLVLQGVADDLAGVASVEIFYSRLSPEFGPLDKDSVLELQHPHNELLIIDLNKMLLRKATRLSAPIRADALAACDAEEALLLQAYLDHVKQYVPMTTRFVRPMPR